MLLDRGKFLSTLLNWVNCLRMQDGLNVCSVTLLSKTLSRLRHGFNVFWESGKLSAFAIRHVYFPTQSLGSVDILVFLGAVFIRVVA